jgi:uncharacterized membrane protein
MKRLLSLATLAALALLLGTPPRAAVSRQALPAYTFTDLGVLDPAHPYTVPFAINNAGQITGLSRYPDGNNRAFRITPAIVGGQPVWFQDANGDGVNDLMQVLALNKNYRYSEGHSINTSGQVAGTGQGSFTSLPQNAFFWDASGAGQATTGTQSWGYGINDAGVMVGTIFPKRGGEFAAMWTLANGRWTETNLGVLPGYASSDGWGVNNAGQVAVSNFLSGPGHQSALWLPAPAYGFPKGMNSLGGIPGHVENWPAVVNNLGEVAGSSDTGLVDAGNRPVYHAYLWLPSAAYGLPAGMNDLHDAGVGVSSEAYGLNQGPGGVLRVVGQVRTSSGEERAFVWDSSSRTMTDLNTVTSLPAGCVLGSSNSPNTLAVNDGGQIVGGSTFNGTYRGFVLTQQ